MYKISLNEFSNLCSNHKNHTYQFDSGNQECIPMFCYKVGFSKIIIIPNQNIVGFKRGEDFMTFKNVTYVEVNNSSSDKMQVFNLVCKSQISENDIKKYTFLLQ